MEKLDQKDSLRERLKRMNWKNSKNQKEMMNWKVLRKIYQKRSNWKRKRAKNQNKLKMRKSMRKNQSINRFRSKCGHNRKAPARNERFLWSCKCRLKLRLRRERKEANEKTRSKAWKVTMTVEKRAKRGIMSSSVSCHRWVFDWRH
jgi:hypothetical protein